MENGFHWSKFKACSYDIFFSWAFDLLFINSSIDIYCFKFIYYHMKEILRQCTKTIHGCTDCNKIQKPCWRQVLITKHLLSCHCRNNKKGCFRYKTEKVNAIIKFYIFELVWITNFSLNWQFWFFGPNLPKFVNGKIALVHGSMLCTGADRHNSILMSLLLIVSETKSRTCLFTNLSSISRFSK